MISGQESADQLGGPIKIAQISGKVAGMDWYHFYLSWLTSQ